MAELQLRDKINLLIIQNERQVKEAKQELHNENLTDGEIKALHLEIEKKKFAVETLKFLWND